MKMTPRRCCFLVSFTLLVLIGGDGVFIDNKGADAFLISLFATYQNCTNEGQRVVVTIVANNPCITCMCQDGHVQCRKETCPSTQGCYFLLPNKPPGPVSSDAAVAAKGRPQQQQCCQICKGCTYRGVHHQSGSQWTDPDDPCQVLACQGGVLTVSKQTCSAPSTCPEDESGEQQLLPPRPGECCPRCRGCRVNGTVIMEGQTVTPNAESDPCTQCQCVQGSTVCTKMTCPVLPCPPNKALIKPGTCCPVCQGVRKEKKIPPPSGSTAAGRCRVGKEIYPSGAVFRPDPCTNCTCQTDSTSICYRRLPNPGESCRASRAITTTTPLPAMQTLSAAEDEDPSSSGAVVSSIQQQEPLPILPPPPTALPASRPTTCAYRGVTYQDGASWSLDPCTQCGCVKGEVRCSVQQCPVYRPEERHHKHKLASSSSSSTGSNGNYVASSSSSTSTSAGQPCPPGRHPVKEPGQCCPKCVEDDAVCTVFGDPHYRTFDGRVFNFQGACKYLLTSDCKNDSFSVRVTNDARTSRSFSWTKTVTLTIEDLKVTLGQNMKVKVNHKRVSLPFVSLGVLSVVQEGYSVVVRTNLGVKLLWDGESFLEVTVPPSFKRRLCGLCGNFNGRRRDDLRMRSGQMARTVEQFGSSWKVGGPKSCNAPTEAAAHRHPNQLTLSPSSSSASSTSLAVVSKKKTTAIAAASSSSSKVEEPLCQKQWHVRIRAVRECSVLKAATFAQCHSQVSPVRYFKSCLLDMCECPPGKQCYCEALTAYAHECARRGVTTIDPKWRQVTACAGHPAVPSSSSTIINNNN